MAAASGITVPVRADPRELVDFARAIAKHMTALADELDQIAAAPALDAEQAGGMHREGGS